VKKEGFCATYFAMNIAKRPFEISLQTLFSFTKCKKKSQAEVLVKELAFFPFRMLATNTQWANNIQQ